LGEKNESVRSDQVKKRTMEQNSGKKTQRKNTKEFLREETTGGQVRWFSEEKNQRPKSRTKQPYSVPVNWRPWEGKQKGLGEGQKIKHRKRND